VEPAQERQIREAYAAFARGDLGAALAWFVPEATFTNPDYAVEGGVRVGRDQLRVGFESLHDQFEYSSLEIEQLVEGPEGRVLVVVHFEGRGRTSGAPLNERFFHVFQMRGEQVLDFAWFTSLEEGRAAVGL
jgi:ketosteroid isomerase-like protein